MTEAIYKQGAPGTVRFNDVDEFLEELKASLPNTEKVIRATKQFEQSKTLPILRVSVIATALRHIWLSESVALVLRIKLHKYVGDCYAHGRDSVSEKTMKLADAYMLTLEDGGKALGLEVRAGVYE